MGPMSRRLRERYSGLCRKARVFVGSNPAPAGIGLALLLAGCEPMKFDREPELVSWQWDIWCMEGGSSAQACDSWRERRMQARLTLVELWWGAGEIDLRCQPLPGGDGYYCGDGIAAIFHIKPTSSGNQ